MVKEKMISVTKLKVVEATQNFIAKYFDDEILAVCFNSSQTSKVKTEKDHYNINFTYCGEKDKVPAFLEVDNYASMLKSDFTEWLGVDVKYFHIDWNLTVATYSFSFSIDIRL